MNRLRLALAAILLGLVWPSVAETTASLQAGPMVCYGQMREVMLWVQTKGPARVRIEYAETTPSAERFLTQEVVTRAETAYTAKLLADQVVPAARYQYDLYIDGQRVELPYPTRFQTPWPSWSAQANSTFTVALGSCAYINEPALDRPGNFPGGGYEIFTTMAAASPDLMLWLGDNIYLREPDWNSRTGILGRYTHARSLPELQPLLASTHHYAIWDDHDFGPNDSDRSFWNKATALEGFQLFWGNPSFGVNGRPGTTTSFEWGDVQFFLLDNRYERTPNHRKTGQRSILGEEQREWLLDALAFSKATFKVVAVGGQFLNSAARHETWANFPEERDELLRALEAEKIPGLFFLSGDRHFTELSRLERSNSYPLHELTVSPLTSPTYRTGATEPNVFRVPGTLVMERNFALMSVGGPAQDRRLHFSIRSTGGQELWSREFSAAELRPKPPQ